MLKHNKLRNFGCNEHGYPRSSITFCYYNHRTQSAKANLPHHHPDGCKFHKSFASLRQKLVILAQSSLVIHPAECALNYPSKFHDFKYLSWLLNHRSNDIEKRKSPINQFGPSVSTISLNQLDGSEENHELSDD